MMTLTQPADLPVSPDSHGDRSTERLVISRISDAGRLPALAEAWERLQDLSHPGAAFRSGAWLVPWWEALGAGKRLSVYVALRGADLVGVLPGYRTRTVLGGWQFRLLGDGVVTSDHLGVVARPEDQETVSIAIGRALLRRERELALEGLDAADPLVRAIVRDARTVGAACAVAELGPCPYLSLDVAGGRAAWLQAHPKANFKKRRKLLERRDGFRIETLTEESAVAEGLAELWRLHRLRWEAEGGSAALTSSRVERFHEASARAFARRGLARLFVLHAEGAPRAARYGIEAGGRLVDYQTGLDPAWHRHSVGSVLLDAVIEDAFARGLHEIDFLRGDEPYKALYTSARRTIVEVRIASSARARLVLDAAQVRDAALRLSPRLLSPDVRARLRYAQARLRGWRAARSSS